MKIFAALLVVLGINFLAAFHANGQEGMKMHVYLNQESAILTREEFRNANSNDDPFKEPPSQYLLEIFRNFSDAAFLPTNISPFDDTAIPRGINDTHKLTRIEIIVHATIAIPGFPGPVGSCESIVTARWNSKNENNPPRYIIAHLQNANLVAPTSGGLSYIELEKSPQEEDVTAFFDKSVFAGHDFLLLKHTQDSVCTLTFCGKRTDELKQRIQHVYDEKEVIKRWQVYRNSFPPLKTPR